MKKYFMSGTQDEVKFGDVIDLDLTKNEDDRTVHKRIYCTFIPEMVPLFLEEGIITEFEDEDIIDFNENDGNPEDEWEDSIAEALTDLIKINQQFLQQLKGLEKEVKELKALVSKAHGKKSAA